MNEQGSPTVKIIVALLIGALLGWFGYAFTVGKNATEKIYQKVEEDKAASEKTFTGTVMLAGPATLTVQVAGETRLVTVTTDTRTAVYQFDDTQTSYRQAIKLTDLKIGDRVTITGEEPINNATTAYAKEITRI